MSPNNAPRILVVGSCGLDRLVVVPSYPRADAKIRTVAYHEAGGGNAANTASAMALLSNVSFLKSKNLTIQLATKLGDDAIGRQIQQELITSGVDISSPLFQIGAKDSTTGFTTIIVSELEKTRTCIHTPGTCGELTMADVTDMDEIFKSVIHFHSDARHTEVALLLAREAKKRKIRVSVDVEKDRGTPALDALMEEADIVFTNTDQIENYLLRLTKEQEESRGFRHLAEPTVVSKVSETDMDLFAHAIRPSSYFTRWFCQSDKEVVITKGHRGALHVRCDAIQDDDVRMEESCNVVHISIPNNHIHVHHSFLETKTQGDVHFLRSADYSIRESGVLAGVRVVDTTGAGDAFMGGYILAQLSLSAQDALRFGCWVGGCKVQGPGARSALPTGASVDDRLGLTTAEVATSLQRSLGPFRRENAEDATVTGSSWDWETVAR